MNKEKSRPSYAVGAGFKEGLRDGIPIALGYFAVAFSLGFMARKVGMNAFQGFLSSFLNHASAGEYAEFTVIESAAPYWEMALIILVTNARYLLMSCALSQRLSPDMGLLHRILVGFSITDEIFGIAIGRKGDVNPWYNYGAMAIAFPCWATGTALGITAGNILPSMVVGALSVALYGMFIQIVIPVAKKNRVILGAVLVSYLLSFLAEKFLANLSGSMRTILLTVLISAVAALLFPVKDEEGEAA